MKAMARPVFQIIRVPEDARDVQESMGSKPKFWFEDEKRGRCLYKEARPGTGEDWAEKVAAHLAGLLGLPHADVELASWSDTCGIVSPKFLEQDCELVHGNELIGARDADYPKEATGSRRLYRIPQHTVTRVLDVIRKLRAAPPVDWSPPPGVTSAAGALVGYVLLDAWIGNTDRHHENWALVFCPHREAEKRPPVYLAPTYDHASSLGRNETDARRKERLTTRDQGFTVEAYATKAVSALFASEDESKPLTTFEAFREAARLQPKDAVAWLVRLGEVKQEDVAEIFDRVPRERISEAAAEFAQAMLSINRRKLLDLRENIL